MSRTDEDGEYDDDEGREGGGEEDDRPTGRMEFARDEGSLDAEVADGACGIPDEL